MTQRSLHDLPYYTERAVSLLRRYGLRAGKGERRLLACLQLLARFDAYPTFAVPGRVVAKNAPFFREVERLGAELAIHGYDHVDFRHLSPALAAAQFSQALEAFQRSGLEVEGFRCPYLSCSHVQRGAVPVGRLLYSSNRALAWDVVPVSLSGNAPVFVRLLSYYQPEPAARVLALPRFDDGLLEIPASLPEDLQLYDGLRFGSEAVARAWTEILERTHRRGELFVLMFHPELFERSAIALEAVLLHARRLTPPVWVTQLRSINRWWREKAAFAVEVADTEEGLTLRFRCSDRATILLRNIETSERVRPWDARYQILESRILRVPAGRRPFIGLARSAPPETASLLREQGYLVDASDDAPRCALYLDSGALAGLSSEVALIEHIEKSPAPLVRFWRWPNGARSALSITGDADALSLRDYAFRLFAH